MIPYNWEEMICPISNLIEKRYIIFIIKIKFITFHFNLFSSFFQNIYLEKLRNLSLICLQFQINLIEIITLNFIKYTFN